MKLRGNNAFFVRLMRVLNIWAGTAAAKLNKYYEHLSYIQDDNPKD